MRRTCLLLASLVIGSDAHAQTLLRPASEVADGTAPAAVATATPAATTTPTASTASTENTAGVGAFRAGVDLVALNVVVTDGQQKFITGLAPDNFAVFEDGVQQDVSFFAASTIPLDLAILLDTSASMSDKLTTAQQAAVGFVSTLRPGDRAMVVDIKDGTRVLQSLDSDLSTSVKAIQSTRARGGTALYNGLYLTLKELIKERRATDEVRRQAIVVLSDGDDTASLLAFDDVMPSAKESGIGIYTITLRSRMSIVQASASGHRYFSQSEFAMKSIAQETGGRSFFPTDIAELGGVYGSIAEELANQYAIGYTSKNPRRDGAFRKVIVQVAEHPGARTRTRSGYVAARAERKVALK